MAFFPDDMAVPVELRTQELWLRVLRPDVTELDYAALMESRERLRLWSDSTWPADDFTLDGNREDLVEHEREWEAREAFAYTVLNPDGSRCDGCIYIDPLAESMLMQSYDPSQHSIEIADDAATVMFWVRESALESNLDRQLLEGVLAWLATDWPFSQVFFRINEHQQRDRELLEALGLERQLSLKSHRSDLIWHLYADPR